MVRKKIKNGTGLNNSCINDNTLASQICQHMQTCSSSQHHRHAKYLESFLEALREHRFSFHGRPFTYPSDQPMDFERVNTVMYDNHGRGVEEGQGLIETEMIFGDTEV